MQTKLAVITTEFLQEFVVKSFEEFHLDFSYQIFLYENYRDVPQVFAAIPDDFDGVIASGIFPATIIRKAFPNTKKAVTYFNSDDAGIFRLFLQLFIEEPSLDLSRIYGDFVEMFGISLRDYLISDQRVAYTELVDPIVSRMSLEELFAIEEAQLERLRTLYRQGEIDAAVMRSSSIVPKLRSEGFKVYFPYPSMEYLRGIVERTLQEIAILRMEGNRPAVVNAAIDISDTGDRGDAFQRRCIALQEALLDYNGSSMLDYVLQQTHFGYEILTNRKTLAERTQGFTACDLGEFLRRRLSFQVFIGYGIGDDLYQARLNAINAGREASLNRSGSFLINEKDNLVGPLGRPESMTVPAGASPATQDISAASGLSPLTVSRVLAAIRTMPDGRITARDLAYKLSITQRSANRFLSALLLARAITVVAEKRATTKGRPERIFQLSPNPPADGGV